MQNIHVVACEHGDFNQIMGYYQLNKLSVCHLWPLWNKIEPMISHMASYRCCYRFKMFCYDGIGAITMCAYTQMLLLKLLVHVSISTTSKLYYPIEIMNRLI